MFRRDEGEGGKKKRLRVGKRRKVLFLRKISRVNGERGKGRGIVCETGEKGFRKNQGRKR